MAESMTGVLFGVIVLIVPPILVVEHYRREHHRNQQIRWLDTHPVQTGYTISVDGAARIESPAQGGADLARLRQWQRFSQW
jgi:hypothetical protein